MLDAFENVWAIIAEDIRQTAPDQKEFAPTKTSRAIGGAIWRTRPQANSHAGEPLTALDVGTGTGVHAFLMAARGYDRVMAIDSSRRAIERAGERWDRLRRRLAAVPRLAQSGQSIGSIEFVVTSIDDVTACAPLALTTFNPTAYFDFLGARSASPAAEAVYADGDWRGGHAPEGSALYRFVDRVVLPHLAAGGHAICTWCALERRLMHVERASSGLEISHPVGLLEKWFSGFKVAPPAPAGEEFFRQRAQILSDYGLGPSFRTNLERGYAAGLYCSELFELGDEKTPPEFRYGVLHLVRTAAPPSLRFQLVESLPEPTS